MNFRKGKLPVLKTLQIIAKDLNRENIVWGLGASMLLNQYGLEDAPRDIDLLIDIKDHIRANQLFLKWGEQKEVEESPIYATEDFNRYVVKGVRIDVMAGFQIRHQNGVYRYPFDNRSITRVKSLEGIKIPLTALEDWYILYQLLPNRNEKVARIERHLKTEGINHRFLLERGLKQNLPINVRKKVQQLLLGE